MQHFNVGNLNSIGRAPEKRRFAHSNDSKVRCASNNIAIEFLTQADPDSSAERAEYRLSVEEQTCPLAESKPH